MKSRFFLAALFIGSLILTSCASYSKIMVKAVKDALGKDFHGYYGFSYPTNNFGLITSFEDTLANENQYCAMIRCLDGINISNHEEWLNIKGLADIGQGGAISISEKKKTKISVDAVLPKLWNVLQLSSTTSNEREVKTILNLGPAYVRFLNKKIFDEYIDELPGENSYKQKYNSGSLVIVVSDVVVEYLTIRIEVDNQLSAILDAKIDAGKISEEFGKIDLDASISKTTSGVYELTIDKPVIILRLTKKQPSSKELRKTDNFDNWIPVRDFIEN
jgi:hypothetical protein